VKAKARRATRLSRNNTKQKRPAALQKCQAAGVRASQSIVPLKSFDVGQSKQARVIAMLRAKAGTTVTAIMKATGWQKHSVHGFFAGIVRKKFGFNLVSETSEGRRIYRIAEAKTSKAAPTPSKQVR
jgi:hypothetical protein